MIVETKSLGEIAILKMGRNLPVKNLLAKGHPVFGANGQIGFYSEYMFDEPVVAVSCRGAKSGVVNYTLPKSFVTNNSITILPKEKCYFNPKYMYFALISKNLTKIVSGSAQPQIIVGDLSKVKISLPPISEQKRIVEILKKADNLRKKRKEANELSNKIIHSTFIDMFGDTLTNPKNWQIIKLKNIIRMNYGKGLHEKERNELYPYWVYGSNGIIGKYKNYFIEEKTIIIGRKGACGEVTLTKPKCWAIDTTFYIEIINRSDINIFFLFYYLKLLNLRNLIITTSIPGINRTALYNIDIFLPPIELQQKFADIVQQIESIKEKQQESEKEINNLFNSLMQKTFKEQSD